MKKTTESGRDRLPCGMVSLTMFKINHSKALIIAYLNLRGGLNKYTFNWRDISNQTNIGETVVRQCLKELVAEGVLNRMGKSFYKLNHQKMIELYYQTSDSDACVSESEVDASENDANVSESDTKVSESDAIHSSILDSRKLDSSYLDTSDILPGHSFENASFPSHDQAPAPLPDKTLTVSGTLLATSKKSLDELFDDIFGSVPSKTKKTQESSESAAFPSNNPTITPMATDTQEEPNDSSACPTANAANNNHPTPSARPEKVGELPVATPPRRSAVDEFLSLPPKERLKWLEAVEANESMVENLKGGKDVLMTEAFKKHFANW
jgi:hypothetical protein